MRTHTHTHTHTHTSSNQIQNGHLSITVVYFVSSVQEFTENLVLTYQEFVLSVWMSGGNDEGEREKERAFPFPLLTFCMRERRSSSMD